jgi:hypothetical protein
MFHTHVVKCECALCNSHMPLQFSYTFAISTFHHMVPMWMFAILIFVSNSHMCLQFSLLGVLIMLMEIDSDGSEKSQIAILMTTPLLS